MSRVDNAARDLLSEFDVTTAPVDTFGLARHLGVVIVQSAMPEDVSGMLIREGNSSTIGLNIDQQHSRQRQRFTVAHELGHLRLHRGRPLIVDSAVRVNMRDATSARATSREEVEANKFAALLLMPESMILSEVRKVGGADPDEMRATLARRFNVSLEAMGYRLVNLGITS